MTVKELLAQLDDLDHEYQNQPVYISVWEGSDGWENRYITGVSLTYKGVEFDYE